MYATPIRRVLAATVLRKRTTSLYEYLRRQLGTRELAFKRPGRWRVRDPTTGPSLCVVVRYGACLGFDVGFSEFSPITHS